VGRSCRSAFLFYDRITNLRSAKRNYGSAGRINSISTIRFIMFILSTIRSKIPAFQIPARALFGNPGGINEQELFLKPQL